MKSMLKPLAIFSLLIAMAGYSPCYSQILNVFPKKEKVNLNSIVAAISNYTSVDAYSTGFNATRSDQYLRFEKLLSIVSDSQLINLTASNNSNIKAYAFWGLIIKRSPSVQMILEDHLRDRHPFTFYSGCVQEFREMNEWCLTLATPWLTQAQVKKYSEVVISSK